MQNHKEEIILLSDFKQLVEDLSTQIIENWCLIKWCDECPITYTANHLKDNYINALKSCLHKISKEHLESIQKEKIIQNIWIKHLKLNDTNVIIDIIRNKFEKEDLGTYVVNIAEKCSKSLFDIIKVLCINSPIKIERYALYVSLKYL